jgi:hypothetical protein
VELSHLSVAELLALHGQISDALRTRGVTRSSNNPVGDLAEYLFCKTFGWAQANKSATNIDAIDQQGRRYQIKGRRLTRHNSSRQLSALRDLDGAHFDFLAGILFAEDYSISRAAIIPHSIVLADASFVKRTNSHRFLLRDNVWDAPGVRDVTAEMRATVI